VVGVAVVCAYVVGEYPGRQTHGVTVGDAVVLRAGVVGALVVVVHGEEVVVVVGVAVVVGVLVVVAHGAAVVVVGAAVVVVGAAVVVGALVVVVHGTAVVHGAVVIVVGVDVVVVGEAVVVGALVVVGAAVVVGALVVATHVHASVLATRARETATKNNKTMFLILVLVFGVKMTFDECQLVSSYLV
jgi:hypothetical protein